jgi:ABC-type lipoprotein release transport system permease subunit
LNDSVFSANVAVISTSAKMIDVGSGVKLKIYGAQNDTTAEAKLCGISSNAALGDFVNGKRNLVEGRMFEAKNECIISKKLADSNKLLVGDELVFENTTLGANGEKIEYRLTIVGIFSDETKEYDSGYKVPYLNRRNEVFTDISTVMDAENAANGAGVMMEAQYYLKDGVPLSDFEKEVRDKGLPSGFSVRKK